MADLEAITTCWQQLFLMLQKSIFCYSFVTRPNLHSIYLRNNQYFIIIMGLTSL